MYKGFVKSAFVAMAATLIAGSYSASAQETLPNAYNPSLTGASNPIGGNDFLIGNTTVAISGTTMTVTIVTPYALTMTSNGGAGAGGYYTQIGSLFIAPGSTTNGAIITPTYVATAPLSGATIGSTTAGSWGNVGTIQTAYFPFTTDTTSPANGFIFGAPNTTTGYIPVQATVSGAALGTDSVKVADVGGVGEIIFTLNDASGFALLSPSFNIEWAITCANGVYVNNFTTSTTELTPTPLPAALPLFASGAGFLGLLNWRRKRKSPVAKVAAA